MGKLIMPKHTGELKYIIPAMGVYFEKDNWVSVEDYKNELVSKLISNRTETTRNPDDSHYTKCSEIPRYFGWLERLTPGNRNSDVRITPAGKKFYNAFIAHDVPVMQECVVEALETVTFGTNNEGCGSDTPIEAPCVMIKAMLFLDGITNKELAYILSEMNDKGMDFSDSVLHIKYYRSIGADAPAGSITSDIKFIKFLREISFLENNANGFTDIATAVKRKYYTRLISLETYYSANAVTTSTSATNSTYITDDEDIPTDMNNFIEALRTKPFLLLAGISGTGKSQKVKEMAYMTCPAEELGSTPTTPGNYCLIEVKPNWHDSSELLGYYSNITKLYHVTDFLRFVYKASKNPDYPFFVCLDEMNLAPVEQYFAEYLSVLETRVVVGDHVNSAMLLTKESFEGYELSDEYSATDREVIEFIQQNGLTLPENLFVIGTVNMDDTTHQFSRKVIDRAFTIEMNGGKLDEMFSDENNNALKYREEPVSLSMFKPKYVKASEALEDSIVANYADEIKKQVPEVLTKINDIFKDTPFRVSYRVQNELIIYVTNLILSQDPSSINIKALINEAALIILLEKILPRVQGDDKLLSEGNESVFVKLITLLKSDFGDLSDKDVYKEVVAKLNEMDSRLQKTYFANFF